MTDLDKMPFGKYKGTLMQDVPCSYLHYFWTQTGFKDIANKPEPTPLHQKNSWQVAQYIKNNLSALKDENEDLIW